jgi:hypothetical protein
VLDGLAAAVRARRALARMTPAMAQAG